MARVVAFLALLLVLPILSGCLGDEDLRPFDDLEVPRWEAGFSWSWDASSSGTWSYESKDGKGTSSGETTTRIEQRVVNTQTPVFGEPVYWVRSDEGVGMDGPGGMGSFGSEGLQAIGQDDLQQVARFYEHRFALDGCEEVVLSGVRVDPAPMLRFPLEQGDRWEHELEDQVTLRAEVRGATEVAVPAGTFDAVEVELRVEIDPAFFEDQDEDEGEQLRSFTSVTRVWYAEAVRNVVRMESETESHVVEDGEGEVVYSATTELALARYALTADVEETLPTIMDLADRRGISTGPVSPPELHVTSDAVFPLNAADQSLDVRFGLASGSYKGEPSAPGIEQGVEVSTDLPWFDEENETILWSFRSKEDVFEARGPSVDLSLPPGGAFQVWVRLVPKAAAVPHAEAVCGDRIDAHEVGLAAPSMQPYGARLANAQFNVEWRMPFAVTHSGAAEEDHVLFDVPILQGSVLEVALDTDHEGIVQDEGALALVLGEKTVRFLESGSRSMTSLGNATAVWEARSHDALGPSGMTFGHTAEGWVHVRY